MRTQNRSEMKHFLVVAICILSLSGFGQTMADKVLKEARALASENKEAEAFVKYKQVLVFDMNNYEALWSCSLLSTRLGRRETD